MKLPPTSIAPVHQDDLVPLRLHTHPVNRKDSSNEWRRKDFGRTGSQSAGHP